MLTLVCPSRQELLEKLWLPLVTMGMALDWIPVRSKSSLGFDCRVWGTRARWKLSSFSSALVLVLARLVEEANER